jgi:hypothetical protein
VNFGLRKGRKIPCRFVANLKALFFSTVTCDEPKVEIVQ